MCSCVRDPGTWSEGRISFVWNLLKHALSRLTELFMGYFLSSPTSRPKAAFHKLLKTRALSFLVCVASNHLFWILHIWKSIQNRKWRLWGILTLPRVKEVYNPKHIHIMQEWWPQSVAMILFSVLESFIFLFLGTCVLISVFHRQ